MNEATCASDLTKSVNVLDAIIWLKTSWDSGKPITIQKCFSNCGFTQAVFADPEENTTYVPLTVVWVLWWKLVELPGKCMQILSGSCYKQGNCED